MWYEVLPVTGIILFLLSAPSLIFVPAIHKALLGKAYKKQRLTDWWTGWTFDRDEDLTGSGFDIVGLDCITDKPSGPTPFDIYSHKDKKKFWYY